MPAVAEGGGGGTYCPGPQQVQVGRGTECSVHGASMQTIFSWTSRIQKKVCSSLDQSPVFLLGSSPLL